MSSNETKNIYILYPFSASNLYPQEFNPMESVCDFMKRLCDKHNLDINKLVLWYYGRQYRGYTMQQSKHVKMKDIRAQHDTCMHVVAGATDARFERSSSRASGSSPTSPRRNPAAKTNTPRGNKNTPSAQNTYTKSTDNKRETNGSKVLSETQNTAHAHNTNNNNSRDQPSRTENSENASYPAGGISNRYVRQLTFHQLSHAGKYTRPATPDEYYYPSSRKDRNAASTANSPARKQGETTREAKTR